MTLDALLVCSDLMTGSHFQAAAARQNKRGAVALSLAAALDRAATEHPKLVILDLTLAGLDPAEALPKLKAGPNPPRVVAFGPHIHEARLAAAQAAGCDQVLSRGAFTRQLDELLSAIS